MRQKSIDIPGAEHSVPIPNACQIGNMVATGGVNGKDPATGKMPADAETQAKNAFANLEAILKVAGLDRGDILKMTVFLADEAHRAAINQPWLEWYPDHHHRPARHALVLPLRGGMLLQLEALAVAKE